MGNHRVALPAPAGHPPTMRLGYRIIRGILQALHIFLCRGRVFGLRHVPVVGGVLLVSNHESFLDPIVATLAIPRECNYMARDTLFRHPLFGRLIAYVNAFPVKRDTADIGAIKETLRRLKAGKVVLTFPEGTRTRDGRIGAMRAGVVLLARKARVPVVPTLVLGAFESWPRSSPLPRPHPILVAYGEPLYVHEHPEWDDEQCVALVRARIVALQERFASHSLVSGFARTRNRS
jgi:1-acyl-sn-glycerol-3-phosphate acyltransferase